jgi:hypothetical protein
LRPRPGLANRRVPPDPAFGHLLPRGRGERVDRPGPIGHRVPQSVGSTVGLEGLRESCRKKLRPQDG